MSNKLYMVWFVKYGLVIVLFVLSLILYLNDKIIIMLYISAHDECANSCSGNSLWKYKIGKTYLYNYKVKVVTMMKGTSDEDSRLYLSLKANFIHTSQCNFDLQVRPS